MLLGLDLLKQLPQSHLDHALLYVQIQVQLLQRASLGELILRLHPSPLDTHDVQIPRLVFLGRLLFGLGSLLVSLHGVGLSRTGLSVHED